MFRAVVIALLGLLLNTVGGSPVESNVDIAVIDNITLYLNENPNIELLYPLEKELLPRDGASPRVQLNYRVGNRINGDRLVSTGSGSKTWATFQDVKFSLIYPTYGTGAVVTFVQVTVQQSENVGRGYVVAGGIGQRQISIVIEAPHTLFFSFNSAVYGY